MQIEYKTRKLCKICTEYEYAVKQYGRQIAEKIHMRIDQITAVDSVDSMLQNHLGKCHALTGNRIGEYAVSLDKRYRLVFTVKEDVVQIAYILEIVDYH